MISVALELNSAIYFLYTGSNDLHEIVMISVALGTSVHCTDNCDFCGS